MSRQIILSNSNRIELYRPVLEKTPFLFLTSLVYRLRDYEFKTSRIHLRGATNRVKCDFREDNIVELSPREKLVGETFEPL